MSRQTLNLAVIGNCQISALIDAGGRMVWACLPRHDGDPMFCSLLGGDIDDGYFDVELLHLASSEQRYQRNTAVVETLLHDAVGGALRISDFCPRHRRFNRMYRPMMIVRIIEPIAGRPVIRLRLRPRQDYGASRPPVTVGSNHVRFEGDELTLRVTTDAPITSMLEERPFVLANRIALVLGPDETLAEAPARSRSRCSMPRSATARLGAHAGGSVRVAGSGDSRRHHLEALHLRGYGCGDRSGNHFDPESASSGRNWDYRFCWLRDSYFTVQALNRLGATRTMEAYLHYIVNIIESAQGGVLQPLYGISGEAQLDERVIETLPGYRAMGPVRVGNLAYQQVQHDVYGAVILAATQAFFDQRLEVPGGRPLFECLERLGEQAILLYDKPDSGLWEYRGRTRIHTFSSAMCWAAGDRLARISTSLGLNDRAVYWRERANEMHARILQLGWIHGSRVSRKASGTPRSTRVCCCCTSSVFCRRAIRGSCRRSARSRRPCGATPT